MVCLTLDHLAVVRGRLALNFLEHATEVIRILVSELFRNFAYRHVGVIQKSARFFNFQLDEVVLRELSCSLFE
jgi:hypothetical protein